MTTVDMLRPLLERANHHPELRIAFHPRRWELVNLVLEALDGEWDIRLRISRDVSPHAIYLMGASPAPISRVQVSSGGGETSMPPPGGLNAGSHRAKPKPLPEVDPPEETP